MRQLVFLIAAALSMLILLGLGIYSVLRARRASRNEWKSLVRRLRKIDRAGMTLVALDLLDGSEASKQLDPRQIFKMIGGMRGLEAVGQNCDVLIELAAYVQEWYPEALQLAEELRLNAREIQWHIGRLRGAQQAGHLQEQFPIYAQRAVATYYLMTRSLLVLYEGVQLPEYAELQRAL